MESLLHYTDMLSMIPKEPDSISTPELLIKLQNAGYFVDLQSIERDLGNLLKSHLFHFSYIEGTEPLRWYWPSNPKVIMSPRKPSYEGLACKVLSYQNAIEIAIEAGVLKQCKHQSRERIVAGKCRVENAYRLGESRWWSGSKLESAVNSDREIVMVIKFVVAVYASEKCPLCEET
jgi:hypothetical protein